MNVLVAGGKLQGTEIAFLAKEAGWHVTLVDRREGALASKLCDDFVCADVGHLMPGFLAGFDVVIPAIEDIDALCVLQDLCNCVQVPFLFDQDAYRISSSKQASDAFLAKLGVRTPPNVDDDTEWSDGYLVKPDSSSGSKGVMRFANRTDALAYAAEHPGSLCQVFLEGDVLSVEVVCDRDNVASYLVTQVVVADDFDCHRIVAPAAVAQSDMPAIRRLADDIGRGLQMRGIFDIEFVIREGVPYVLEIDARMPSQTPIAIYYATGTNLVVEAVRAFCHIRGLPETRVQGKDACSILQHVSIENGRARLVGECHLGDAPALVRADGLFGADVALASYSDDHVVRYATLITCGDDAASTEQRMQAVLDAACDYARSKEDGRS